MFDIELTREFIAFLVASAALVLIAVIFWEQDARSDYQEADILGIAVDELHEEMG